MTLSYFLSTDSDSHHANDPLFCLLHFCCSQCMLFWLLRCSWCWWVELYPNNVFCCWILQSMVIRSLSTVNCLWLIESGICLLSSVSHSIKHIECTHCTMNWTTINLERQCWKLLLLLSTSRLTSPFDYFLRHMHTSDYMCWTCMCGFLRVCISSVKSYVFVCLIPSKLSCSSDFNVCSRLAVWGWWRHCLAN